MPVGTSDSRLWPTGSIRVSLARDDCLGRMWANLVQIIILPDELLQLGLHIDNSLGRKFELHHWDPGLLEVLQEPNLRRLKKHQASALAIGPACRATHPMDVVARVIWGIKLDDPVDRGNLRRSSA